jgi:transcriptional regulator with GAF, ATPase, and Fis domain
MLQQKETICPEIVADINKTITQRKALEKHPEVKLLHEHEGWIEELGEVLRGSWKSAGEKVQEQCEERLAALDKLQDFVRNEKNLEKRELLIMKCKEEQEKLDISVSNLKGMESMMGVAIKFLNSMKKQLAQIENKLISIGEDVAEIKKDIKYLTGKKISELYEFKYQKVMADPFYNKLNIPVKAKEYHKKGLENESQIDLFTECLDFIKSRTKSTLLISGEAGSGKSTVLKYVEHQILKLSRKKTSNLVAPFQDFEWEEIVTIQSNLDELSLSPYMTTVIKNLSKDDNDYRTKLFFSSEVLQVKKRMSEVIQTQEIVGKLKEANKKEGIILPIWCSLPTATSPLSH